VIVTEWGRRAPWAAVAKTEQAKRHASTSLIIIVGAIFLGGVEINEINLYTL
jgi:hypothetical protein